MTDTKGNAKATVEFSITLTLTLGEAKALDAIVGYGPNRFIEWFYKNLGKAYLQPHERDTRALFDRVRTELLREISRIERVKKSIDEALKDFDARKPTPDAA